MAKRILTVNTVTPTATADTVGIVDNTYVGAILGASATQRTFIKEIYMGGQATASAPTYMVLARDSTVAGTLVLGTGQHDAALDPASAALAAPVVVGNSATTDPQRSSTLHLLNLSFNAFGGIVRWFPADGEAPSIVGSSASLGEVSLSAFTGGAPGAMGAHIVYETM
jgi:hypothetical protein